MEETLIPNFSVTEFAAFLATRFNLDIAEEFERNKMSGSVFLKLSENQIEKMVPAIGDIVELQSLQSRIISIGSQTNQVLLLWGEESYT